METPDPWQRTLLSQLITRQENALVLCSRGAGKSQVTAAAMYLEACLGGFAMVVSRSDDQALEMFRYVTEYHNRLQLRKAVRENMHEIEFAGGGRLLARPCREDTLRGKHKVSLLVIDEASRVPDMVYKAVTAMTAISKGRVALLTTPFGQRGFFYNEWVGKGADNWHRHRYSWRDCPRLTEEHIETERRRHGNLWVRQEYLDCEEGQEFVAVNSSVFNVQEFQDLIDPSIETIDW